MLAADTDFGQSRTASPAADAKETERAEFPLAFGDYLLESEIAHGGMGVVYKARQRSLDRVVAVKLLLLGRYSSAESIDRFRREAQSAAALRHPYIVSIHEVGQHDGQYYITMEYVEGRNLAEVLGREPMPARQAAAIVQSIAEAIQYAHSQGVLHRDLKPSNVLIDVFGEARLTDFGLAKKLDGSSDLTVTGQMLGTPNYLSPEQAAGNQGAVGPASDIYSMGALLYETLTGRPPFLSGSLQDTLARIRDQEPVSPRTLNPALDREIETICLRCLQKEPKHRYGSAQGLAEDLQRWLRHEPIQARPVPTVTRAWLWCRRKPLQAVMFLLLIVVFGAGFVGVLTQWRRAERHRRLVETEQAITRRHLYASDMFAASKALQEGDVGLTHRLLDRHEPSTNLTASADEDLRGFEWWYLRANSQGDAAMVLHGHTNMVQCVAFSPDGRYVASGGFDGLVKLWDAQSGAFLTNLFDSMVRTLTVSFSADGNRLAAAGWQGTRILDLKRNVVLGIEPGNFARAAFSPTGDTAAWSSGNNYWYGLAGETRLGTALNAKAAWRLTNSGGRMAFSGDGRILATGVTARRIHFWETATGQEIGSATNIHRLAAMAMAYNGLWVAAAVGEDNQVRVWSVPSGEQIAELGKNRLRVRAVAATPTEDLLASAGEGQQIQLWDVSRRELVSTLSGHDGEVHALAFSADGKWLASGGKDETVRLWKVHADRQQGVIPMMGCRFGLAHPLFSPDGRLIAANTPGDDLHVFDVGTRREVKMLAPMRKPVAFSPDGQLLATVTVQGLLETWDAGTGSRRGGVLLSRRPQVESSTVLSPDGSLIGVSTGSDMFLCDTRDGQELAVVARHKGLILGSSFSPDGKWLATVGQDATVRIWSVEARTPFAVLHGHKADTRGVAFSPDGRMLATGSFDDVIKIWDVAAAREIVTLRGHMSPVNAVAFTRNGKSLLSLGEDSLRFWNVSIWREAGAIQTTEPNRLLALSEKGNVAAICDGAADGPLRFFAAPRDDRNDEQVQSPVHSMAWALTNLPPISRLSFGDRAIPPRNADTPGQCLDLGPYYNGALDRSWVDPRTEGATLVELLDAPKTLAGVRWDARGVVQLDGKRQRAQLPIFPESVRDIPVNRRCARVHFLASCHWAPPELRKVTVARFVFRYADGQRATRDVTLGTDVADWWYRLADPPEVPGSIVAWTGGTALTRTHKYGLRVFRITWENPRPNEEVLALDLVSTMEIPSLNVLAVTTE